jgi:hypothetical protein
MSLYIDIKYLHAISHRLENYKKKSQDLYNCRCPICGDSQQNKKKARGYFYRGKNDLYYKCHKCGASQHFGTFLKHFDSNQYSQYVVERYTDGGHGRGTAHKDIESVFKFKAPKFDKKPEPKLIDSIMDRLDTLSDDNEAVQYAINRRIPRDAFSRLYFIHNVKDVVQLNDKYKDSIVTSEPRLAIPFLDGTGKLLVVSLRGIRGESLRYINVKIDEDAPSIFGLECLDPTKEVLVVEGPLDSLFLDNAIACAGTSFNKIDQLPIPKENITIIFDNQPKNREVGKLMNKYIEQGYKIVIWPDGIDGKDINEMIENGLTSVEIRGIINDNTVKDLAAKIRYAMWRKV